MIELQIEEYCQDCNQFKPECEQVQQQDLYFNDQLNTTIFCKRRDQCRAIQGYLLSLIGKEK